MENNNLNINNDLKKLLDNYLRKTDIFKFINAIDKDNILESPAQAASEIDQLQLDLEVSSGIDNRVLVDKIITLAEKMLDNEKFYHLLLDLSKMMTDNGELNFAFEIAQDLINKIESSSNYTEIHAETESIISKIYWCQAQWEDSEYHCEEAYKLFKLISKQSGYARCENMYGTLYGEKGDFIKAQEHFKKALTYLNNDEDISLQAMILTNLGIINTITGNFEQAIWNHKNSIEKFEKLNDLNRVARVYHNIGMLYTRMLKYDEALEEFNKCITVSLETNYLSNCAIAYIGKAYIYTKLNNQQLADAFTDKAMEIAYKINDTLSIADIYKIKGMINSDLENFELSEEFFENSLRLNDDFENSLNKAESSAEIGKLLERTDRKEEAAAYVNSALNYFRALNEDRHIAGLAELPI